MVRAPQKSTACCWGYHLSLIFYFFRCLFVPFSFVVPPPQKETFVVVVVASPYQALREALVVGLDWFEESLILEEGKWETPP